MAVKKDEKTKEDSGFTKEDLALLAAAVQLTANYGKGLVFDRIAEHYGIPVGFAHSLFASEIDPDNVTAHIESAPTGYITND